MIEGRARAGEFDDFGHSRAEKLQQVSGSWRFLVRRLFYASVLSSDRFEAVPTRAGSPHALFFSAVRCKKEGMGIPDVVAYDREARAARETVFAVRAADRNGIVLRGEDRIRWLNGLITCDLAKLGVSGGAYGLLVEKKGRIQTDFFIVPARPSGSGLPDSLALALPRDLRDAILATLDHHLIMEDAELEAAEIDFWHLHGPMAPKAAEKLAAPFSGTLDLLGAGGAVLGVPAAEGASFAERVAKVVAELGGTIGEEASWEAVRIEKGLPRFGVEVDATLYPQEAALEKLAVSFDKGCYLGQEVVYMLENRGHVKRKLVPLDIDGDVPLTKGDAITTAEGVAVGDVKSSVVGPSTKKPVAIAMVKWAHAKPGTELRAGDRIAVVRAKT